MLIKVNGRSDDYSLRLRTDAGKEEWICKAWAPKTAKSMTYGVNEWHPFDQVTVVVQYFDEEHQGNIILRLKK